MSGSFLSTADPVLLLRPLLYIAGLLMLVSFYFPLLPRSPSVLTVNVSLFSLSVSLSFLSGGPVRPAVENKKEKRKKKDDKRRAQSMLRHTENRRWSERTEKQ